MGTGGEEQIEASVAPESSNFPGTVRAQGQVRSSVVATPTGQSSAGKTGTTPRRGKLNEKLAELAESLSPKKPSPHDDGAASTGDPEDSADTE